MSEPVANSETRSKIDPEALVLRGRPRRVVRFRRGVIIAGAGFASVAMLGVTWFGLRPAIRAGNSDVVAADPAGARRPPEALADAPGSYGEVPRLGPPLPGDLGRPILEQQRALAGEAAPVAGAYSPGDANAAAEAQARRAADLEAARRSAVLIQRETSASATAAWPAAATGPMPGSDAAPMDPRGTSQQHTAASAAMASDRNPFEIQPAPSPFTLSAGSVLSASLITGLDSDVPGIVTAQITENVYDSATGRILLVPQGSRLIGRHDNVVAFGQRRALVMWQRVLFPDGASVRIENWPASDASGYSGLSDRLDLHTFQLLKGVALSTLLGVGTEIGRQSESDLVEALRESAQQAGARGGDQLVAKNLSVAPTIRVRPGWPLRVIVHKDLVLRPWNRRL